jgi:RNA polymerase sigma-70 factor (ECF subfamily)
VEENRHILVRRAVDMVLDDCKEETRQAFLRVVIAGQDPDDVARGLGMTRNAVYLAKSKILRRIRQEFAQLVDT